PPLGVNVPPVFVQSPPTLKLLPDGGAVSVPPESETAPVTLRLPEPALKLPPVTVTTATVSVWPFRLNVPDPDTVAVAGSAICWFACNGRIGVPVPPTVRLPAMAVTLAVLLRLTVPSLTVVRPV